MKKIVLPEEKLNALAQEISDRLIKNHYFNKGVIRGEELKQFADHKQINKFLLFQVYQVWNMQISKLKHPYFDFEQEEIQHSLQLLRNQLSRHISIAQDDFRPMLKRAVYNNLKLLVDPSSTFEGFFFANREKTPVDLYERYTPFFSDFDFIVNSILHYHKKNHLDTVEKDVFFLKMERVINLYEQKRGVGFETYRSDIIKTLTDRGLDELLAEVAQEEEARKAMLQEEAQRQAAEEARRREEEARKQAELEKQKKQKEEEALKKRLEEEAKRKSFFDTLEGTETFFELGDEEPEGQQVAAAPTEAPAEEVTEELPEDTSASQVAAATVTNIPIEAAETPAVPEAEAPEEPAEETESSEEAPAIAEAPAEETQAVFTPLDQPSTEPEAIAPAQEEEAQEAAEAGTAEAEVAAVAAVEEAAEPETTEEAPIQPSEQATFPEAQAEEEKPKTIADRFSSSADAPRESTIMDRFKPSEEGGTEAEQTVSTPKQDRPETIGERLSGGRKEAEGEQAESTTSFLDRFLNRKKQEEPPKPPQSTEHVQSVADQIGKQDKPQTVADRYQGAPDKRVHESLNGDNKIKLNEIPIHKQYQFVQKVFDGNNVRFRIIVDKVNNARAKEEVEEILDKFVLSKDDIDQNDGVVQEFIQLLRHRF